MSTAPTALTMRASGERRGDRAGDRRRDERRGEPRDESRRRRRLTMVWVLRLSIATFSGLPILFRRLAFFSAAASEPHFMYLVDVFGDVTR